jgi:hypothetical protein
MIENFRLVFPYVLIFYFVRKGIKEPLYFLGIPFLIYMSQSIFFEGVKLFTIPGRLLWALQFIWLIIVWIVSIILDKDKKGDGTSKIQRLYAMDYCIFGLMIISFIGLGMTIVKYSILTDVFKEFIVLISLLVSYFIMKRWFSRNDPELLLNFLYSLVVINSIASLFYVIHQGLNIKIYQESLENAAEIFQGEEISRTFWFMPQFLPFSIAFILVFKERRPFVSYLLLIVNLLAIYISYTRSLLINAAIIFLFYFMVIAIKKGKIGLFFQKILIYSLLFVFGLIILIKIFPAKTEYFINRFTELTETSATSRPNNFKYRFIMTGIIISNIDEDKKLLGMGPVSENQISWVRAMKSASADMVWAGVIFRWGFVGLILFIFLFIFSVIKAFLCYMKSEGVISDLILILLLYIITQFFEGFVSWTFLSGHGLVTGLWYFALLSALVRYIENKELSDEKIN